MKKKSTEEPSRFPYDPDGFARRDYRVVDVAKVAALFLRDGDEDYAHAALRALRLMDVCDRVLRGNANQREAAKVYSDKLKATGGGAHAITPFKRGIKFITGEKRADRAETAFLTFLEVASRGADKRQIAADYSACEAGFSGEELVRMRSKYDALRDNGTLTGRKRRHSKK